MNQDIARFVLRHANDPDAPLVASLLIEEWMGDKSEECYAAGWMSGCEADLGRLVDDGGGEWGMGEVTSEEARLISDLREIGGWWRWDDKLGHSVPEPARSVERV